MDAHIKHLLIRGEDEGLDFKQSISSASKIAKTMTSFANHKGGILLVGVRDNKTISGIETEDEKYMLGLAAEFYCKPEIKIEILEHEFKGLTILECKVPEGEQKPYYAKDDEDKWWVYIRVNDKSLLASKIVVDVLSRAKSGRGSLIKYGKNEHALLKYLQKNERITLNDYKKLVNISKWRASRILVNLISAGVIRNHRTEKTEYFTLA
jgi:predicted HTH transcriptional regulator